MSDLWKAEIVNVIVLAAVLLFDVGPHRKVGLGRLLRPVVAAAVIVPLFLHNVDGGGDGLLLELAGVVAGVLVGLLALSQLRVYRSERTGRAVSRAGIGYVVVWVAVVAARGFFSYGTYHLYTGSLLRWLDDNHIPGAALADALVFMAITMLLARTVGLAVLARRVNRQPLADRPRPATDQQSRKEAGHRLPTAP